MIQTDSHYTFITLLLFWCALVVVSGVYVTIPLTSDIAGEFYVTETTAASAGSVFSLFYAVGFLVFGPMSDKFGRKRMIVTGMGLLSAVTLAVAYAETLMWLIALRGAQGFFAATFAPAALAYVFDVFPKRRLVTAIGFISFGFLTAGQFISTLK
ncbi:MFS transporter [Virgibacillus kekensis]|uniref:MFS transporter n=1 Tax=Virgibacillus kekensis TaxID=202261 RepID=A0ABV9DMK5_9BACI